MDILSELEALEAKQASGSRGVLQLAAQLFDIGKAKARNEKIEMFDIKGILSTGRMWRFFTMEFRPTYNKPLIKFDGQLPLRVIRSIHSIPQPIPKGRCSSGLYASQNVDRKEVADLLLAMLATIASSK